MILEPRTARPSPGARKDWSGLVLETRPHARALAASDRAALGKILLEDVVSEYDARFLSRHVHGLPLTYSPPFLAAERRWRADEERHFRFTAAVYDEHWGLDSARVGDRSPDFGPLAPLFTDELAMLVLFAYDELATVRAYRANLSWYAKLGPAYLRWARALIADEAWHYSAFLAVIRSVHRARLDEARALLDRVIELEGTPYAATFVLDHDDPVFTQAILADAEGVLRRHLAPGNAPDPGRLGRS